MNADRLQQTLDAILQEFRAANKIQIMGQTITHQLLNGILMELQLGWDGAGETVDEELRAMLDQQQTFYAQTLAIRMDEFNQLVHPYDES